MKLITKKTIAAIPLMMAFSIANLTGLSPVMAAVSLRVVPESSQIKWFGSKGIQALGTHTGSVKVKNGKVNLDDAGNINAAELTMDMKKISNDDLSGEWQEKLLTHLRSADFFDVEKHPVSTFKSSKVEKLSETKYKLIGKMTIKGISKPAVILGEYKKNGAEHLFKGDLVFNRLDYNIRYGSGQFFTNLGDKMIQDQVKLSFEVKGV
jgi:polyisoprenoid-binding protein YceI